MGLFYISEWVFPYDCYQLMGKFTAADYTYWAKF